MVSHLASFLYVEFGDEVHETSFQSFKVVNVEMVSPIKEVKNDEFLMVSWKDARTVIEARYPKGWGSVLEFPINKDCSGLGYHSQTVKKPMPNAMEGQVLPLLDIFTSARHLVDGQISAMDEEEDGVANEVRLVYQRLEGQEMGNWTSIEIPEFTMIEK